MTRIWLETNGDLHLTPLTGLIHRLVTSQEQAATLSLVTNVHEQGVLEELIESTKIPLPKDQEHLHYLLKSPFRSPSFHYGSRFGSPYEPSLFYGSLTMETALIETAFYRFVYISGPETPFRGTIINEYSSFNIEIRSLKGVCLDLPPFSDYETRLISPNAYSDTQKLGSDMRDSGVEAFRYTSARDKNKGNNIALFSPDAFFNNKPANVSNWLCQTSINETGFLSKENQIKKLFQQEDFWVENAFPALSI